MKIFVKLFFHIRYLFFIFESFIFEILQFIYQRWRRRWR